MTIDEAIEVLGDILRYVKPGDPPEEHDAITLGIEALKTIKAERTIYGFKRQVRLPGETEE